MQSWGIALFLGAVLASVLGFLGGFITTAMCTELPPSEASVGGLSRWYMAHSPDLSGPIPGESVAEVPTGPSRTVGALTREQVAERVRQIVVEQLGCGDSYREDARFVEDLGLS